MPRFVIIAHQDRYFEAEIEAEDEMQAWELSGLIDESVWTEIGCEDFEVTQIEEMEE